MFSLFFTADTWEMCLYVIVKNLHHSWVLNSAKCCRRGAGSDVKVHRFCWLFNHFAVRYLQISTSLRAQIGERLRILDLILWMNSTTAIWLRNNAQNKATTATCEMRFGSFPNYIFKTLGVEMTSIMITVKKQEEVGEFRAAVWLNALTFPSSSWDDSHPCCSQPVGLLPTLPIPTCRRAGPDSSLNSAEKLAENNNAAPEWLTANNENTQQLGFGRVCVYSGVHWQWHIEPGGLPNWYEPFISKAAFVMWHPWHSNTHTPFITIRWLLHKVCK